VHFYFLALRDATTRQIIAFHLPIRRTKRPKA
jgi:hypothetical protein